MRREFRSRVGVVEYVGERAAALPEELAEPVEPMPVVSEQAALVSSRREVLDRQIGDEPAVLREVGSLAAVRLRGRGETLDLVVEEARFKADLPDERRVVLLERVGR